MAMDKPRNADRDVAVMRAGELIAAGMGPEAALELERNEKDTLKRLGGDKALPFLLGLYQKAEDLPPRLPTGGVTRRGWALAADLRSGEGTRALWQAAFPKAYAPLVEKYGPPAGNPELYAVHNHAQGIGVRSPTMCRTPTRAGCCR